MKIVSGPNVNFYLITALFLGISWHNRSPLPFSYWIAFNLIMIPVSIWLYKWNKKQNQKMVEDFPLDPFIQNKYGTSEDRLQQ
jgi:hypothetical protein